MSVLVWVRFTWFWGKTIHIKDVHTKEIVTVHLEKKIVSSVRFHIKGTVDGPATFYWNCRAETRESCLFDQRVEGGKINIISGGDWYTDTYTFVYEPSLEAKQGSIQIRYE